jgi:RyR domain
VSQYRPKPIDTDKVVLPEDLESLTERLAENAHDHWALQRMSEGWRWGETRNDQARTHPNLVPYGELSDSEKEYDRKTAMETLKAILKLGYRVERA